MTGSIVCFDRDYCAIYCTGRRQPPRYACARAYWQYGSVSCSDKRATSQSQSQSIACICKSGRSATEAFNTVCLCAAPRRDASSVTKRRRCLGLWVHAAGVPDLLLGRFAHVGGIGCCTSRARARCLRLVHSYAFFRHRVRSLPEPFSSSAFKIQKVPCDNRTRSSLGRPHFDMQRASPHKATQTCRCQSGTQEIGRHPRRAGRSRLAACRARDCGGIKRYGS